VDAQAIADLFTAFGPVDVRRMFGSRGIFADGLMFALESKGVIYLRTDESGQARFRAAGCEPFSYLRRGEPFAIVSYWRVPDDVLEDADELAAWSRASCAVAAVKKVSRRGAKRRRIAQG
jgi:DNA transformation protein